jgi:hypothetical protein
MWDHAHTVPIFRVQLGGFGEGNYFLATFPDFTNKGYCPAWIVLGDIVADFFKVRGGERGENAGYKNH